MKLLEPKQNHVWHIRLQLWANGRRHAVIPYRVIADSSQHAVDALMKRLHRKRGQVVTRIKQGKAVGVA